MSHSIRILAMVSLVVSVAVVAPLTADAFAPRAGGGEPTPTPAPAPASIYSGRLIGSNGEQDPEVDLGLITSIHYYANTTNNQSIAISAKKGDKTNLCMLQFNPSVMSKTWPAVTRAEAVETHREIVAAARTPNGKIVCMSQPSSGPGSISKAQFTGVLHWIVMGSSGAFQVISQ